MILFLYLILSIACILVFVVSNPITAALWLILTFLLSSALLWLFNVEFFALIYIIIYVGAIAVLFLFVIMMLDIKSMDMLKNLNLHNLNTLSDLVIRSVSYLLPVWFFSWVLSTILVSEGQTNFEDSYVTFFDILSHLQVLGQVIFNYYIFCVLIAGFVLLVAIIGAIILTLEFNSKSKIKLYSRQLSRSENFLSFFK